MLPAYVYARFSSLEQSKGDSLERQLRGGEQHARRQGWSYSPARHVTDEGKSGWRGANRSKGGALYEFERRAASGDFASGAVLVVENLDRLTRQGYEAAMDLVRALTRAGVTVSTWQDNQVYHADRRIDLPSAMMLIIQSELAHEESQKKSVRLRGSWERKVERARAGDGRAITRMMPGWLRADEQGVIHAIPERVAVLERIFSLYVEGWGLPRITRMLNDEGVENWGRGRHGSKGWSVATTWKYLTSRTVLGEYQPRTRSVDGASKIARPVVLPNYYPQVIAPDVFAMAQRVRKARPGKRVKNSDESPNIFLGVVTCYHCGGPMTIAARNLKGTVRRTRNKNGTWREHKEKEDRSYLRCQNAVRGYGCDNRHSHRYEHLEAAVLETAWMLARLGNAFTPTSAVSRLRTSVAEQARLIEAKREEMESLLFNLGRVVSTPLAQRLADLEKEVDADKERLRDTEDQLALELGGRRPEQELDELLALKEAATGEDVAARNDARRRIHQILRNLLSELRCDKLGGAQAVVGDNGYRFLFEHGVPVGGTPGRNVLELGPNGEIDWNPDFPDAEYEFYPVD